MDNNYLYLVKIITLSEKKSQAGVLWHFGDLPELYAAQARAHTHTHTLANLLVRDPKTNSPWEQGGPGGKPKQITNDSLTFVFT